MTREYRSRPAILLALLRAVKAEPGIGPGRLISLVNLSTDRFKNYMDEATTKGLVEEVTDGERRGFILAPRGQEVLVELDRVERFMSDFGMNL